MDFALECGRALSPRALLRSVASTGSSLTRRVLFPAPAAPPRPYRVCNRDGSSRKGLVAGSLKELVDKAVDTFLITTSPVTLVLEEDGTMVDTEEFFQSLEDNTHFMLLEDGDKWTQEINGVLPQKKAIAKVTFDFYKLNPKDFIGCLNIRATFYDMYSVSYDLQGIGARNVLRKLLRLISYLAQAAGHCLIQSGACVLRWTGDSGTEFTFSNPPTTR